MAVLQNLKITQECQDRLMATDKFVKQDEANEGSAGSQYSVAGGLSEPTIDIGSLFTPDVSLSGSFDLRRFRLSSVGKLLEALPIPIFLVNEHLVIDFANDPGTKFLPNNTDAEGSRFGTLFANPHDVKKGEQLIKKVLAQRIPLVAEALLGDLSDRMLGRIHLRSLRIQKVKYILVVVEDLKPLQDRLRKD